MICTKKGKELIKNCPYIAFCDQKECLSDNARIEWENYWKEEDKENKDKA